MHFKEFEPQPGQRLRPRTLVIEGLFEVISRYANDGTTLDSPQPSTVEQIRLEWIDANMVKQSVANQKLPPQLLEDGTTGGFTIDKLEPHAKLTITQGKVITTVPGFTEVAEETEVSAAEANLASAA